MTQNKRGRTNAARKPRRMYTPEEKAAARALYEMTPKMSLPMVADQVGIPVETIKSWACGERGNGGRWAKIAEGVTEQAHLLANKHKTTLAELGPSLSMQDTEAAEKQTSGLAAVEARASIIGRHRTEWNAPRQLAYEAVKTRDINKAKLAKMTAETLKLVQEGERKAWGLDVGGDNKITVTVERT